MKPSLFSSFRASEGFTRGAAAAIAMSLLAVACSAADGGPVATGSSAASADGLHIDDLCVVATDCTAFKGQEAQCEANAYCAWGPQGACAEAEDAGGTCHEPPVTTQSMCESDPNCSWALLCEGTVTCPLRATNGVCPAGCRVEVVVSGTGPGGGGGCGANPC